MVNKKLLGKFRLGGFDVSLFSSPNWGGEFTFAPGKEIPELVVGFGPDKWEDVVSILLHEAFEFEMAHSDCRFYRSYDFGSDSASYTFMFDHPKFSDLCGRVAIMMTAALPVLAKAWKEFKRKPCSKKQSKGSRNSKKNSRKKARRIAESAKPVSST